MDEQLRKRLEEAADKYADGRRNCTAGNGFLAGAEYGYKEAVKVAKEWLDSKVCGYLGLINENGLAASIFKTAQFLADFESDMNKL